MRALLGGAVRVGVGRSVRDRALGADCGSVAPVHGRDAADGVQALDERHGAKEAGAFVGPSPEQEPGNEGPPSPDERPSERSGLGSEPGGAAAHEGGPLAAGVRHDELDGGRLPGRDALDEQDHLLGALCQGNRLALREHRAAERDA
jgi:hypothetical protein